MGPALCLAQGLDQRFGRNLFVVHHENTLGQGLKLAEPPQQLRVAGVDRTDNDRTGFRVQAFGFLSFGDEASTRKLKVDIHIGNI